DKRISDETARTVLERFVRADSWGDFVRKARSRSEARLRKSERVHRLLHQAAAEAREARDFEELQLRARFGDSPAMGETETRSELWSRLLLGIDQPLIRADSVAAVVVSRREFDRR